MVLTFMANDNSLGFSRQSMNVERFITVAQTRHFIKICSTILQFAPRFYNLLHVIVIYIYV